MFLRLHTGAVRDSLNMQETVGRPKKSGPPSDVERQRGRLVSAWIRRGMVAPHQVVEFSNADVARLIKMSASSVGNYVNDCYDAKEDRMKFPSQETMEKIAQVLRIDLQEGLAARWWKPTELHPVSTKTKRLSIDAGNGTQVEIIVPINTSELTLARIQTAVQIAVRDGF